jgi:hypothetical protein
MATGKKKIHRTGPLQQARDLGWEREEDFAATVVAWLRALKWEIYQEVEFHGSVADIVAVQGPVVWIVETKLCFSAELLWQATQWREFRHACANYVSVAVPTRGRGRERKLVFEQYCRQNGIGVLEAHNHYWGYGKESKEQYDFDEAVKPEFLRWPDDRQKFVDRLTEKHKTYAKAGNAKGLRYTPWKATCEAVAEKARENPGISMKECIDGIKHHYSSNSCARNSMAKWIDAGKVEGVRCERQGRLLRLYPTNGKGKK